MIDCSSPHHLHGPITIRSGGGEDKLLSTDQGRSHLSMSDQEKGFGEEKLKSEGNIWMDYKDD